MLLLIIGIGLVSASPHYGISYNIYGDKTLVEINFGEVSDFEFNIPYDAKTIEVNTESYELIESLDGKLLKVGYSSNLQISYVADFLIEKTPPYFVFLGQQKRRLVKLKC